MDSGFFVSGTWFPDFHLQWGSEILELYSGFQIPGFQISIFNGVPNSLSGIPDFKSQGSGVHKQKFPVKGEGGEGGGVGGGRILLVIFTQ